MIVNQNIFANNDLYPDDMDNTITFKNYYGELYDAVYVAILPFSNRSSKPEVKVPVETVTQESGLKNYKELIKARWISTRFPNLKEKLNHFFAKIQILLSLRKGILIFIPKCQFIKPLLY